MALVFANNAVSLLASGITNIQTTLTVTAGQGARFPVNGGSDTFYITVEDRTAAKMEIMLCTLRSTDTLTVTRAQDGTTAQAFSAGAVVSMRVNKAILEYFRDISLGGAGSFSSLTSTGAITINGGASTALYAANANATVVAGYRIQTGGNDRWRVIKSTTAESGSNAGSDLQFSRYSDAGSLLGSTSVARATGKWTFEATVAAAASVNLPHGTAPSSPVNGDQWTTTAGWYARINGTTVQVLSVATAASTYATIASVTAKANATDALLDQVRWTRSRSITSSTDLDTILTAGFYDILNPTNGPGVGTWHLEVQRYSSNSNYVLQIARALDATASDGYWVRNSIAGVFGSWVKMLNASNGVPSSRTITSGTGLTGGVQDLTANRTIAVDFATTGQATTGTSTSVVMNPAVTKSAIQTFGGWVDLGTFQPSAAAATYFTFDWTLYDQCHYVIDGIRFNSTTATSYVFGAARAGTGITAASSAFVISTIVAGWSPSSPATADRWYAHGFITQMSTLTGDSKYSYLATGWGTGYDGSGSAYGAVDGSTRIGGQANPATQVFIQCNGDTLLAAGEIRIYGRLRSYD